MKVGLDAAASNTLERIISHRVIGVVRTREAIQARGTALALIHGGVRTVEITSTVPRSSEVIRELVETFGSEVVIGAGTILTADAALIAADAGASFVVSPVAPPELPVACHDRGMIAVLGGLTPSELVHAASLGADLIKVFPSNLIGGARYIADILAPLPHLPLAPSGGITLANVRDHLAAGARAVIVGSALTPAEFVENGDWDAIAERARMFVRAIQSGGSHASL